MSVLIKGLAKPKECADCYIRERDTCPLLKANVSGWGIMVNCPIIELPDHGDLIDRDNLIYELGEEDEDLSTYHTLLYAPVVIPAERSEDEKG